MFSGLLADGSVGSIIAPVVTGHETTRIYFPYSESGRTPRFTEKVLRNNLSAKMTFTLSKIISGIILNHISQWEKKFLC